jgi:hypothetical protein
VANEQNLRPARSKIEARERGKAGGIASGKARREKKLAAKTYAEAMRELLKRAYRTDLSTSDVKDTCEAFGLNPTQTGAMALAFSDFSRALNGDEASMERVLKATVASDNAEQGGMFETPAIYVLPSAKDGEEVILPEKEEDGEGT